MQFIDWSRKRGPDSPWFSFPEVTLELWKFYNKIASINRFHKTDMNREFIVQKFHY